MLGLDDPAYAEVTASYRKACGLPPVHIEVPPADFSGTWVLNEQMSDFGPMGAGFSPARLIVTHQGNVLTVRSTVIREFTDDETTEAKYVLDGSESKSEFMRSPRTTVARMSADGSTLIMDSVIALVWGPPGTKLKRLETWTILRQGDRLSIHAVSDSFRGPGKVEQTLIFDRR
jgi:hypothetical protein